MEQFCPLLTPRMKFGMSPTQFTQNTCIVVMEILMEKDTIQLGALVDSVLSVVEIEDDQIQPPPSLGSKYKSEFILGVAKVEEKFIMILDMDKVFSSDELILVMDSTEDI
ncbi:MAG: chemotaxis protein CheW [Comamonadaceae bacterium]|nr:chemotaxis protein CheW [Comamonadaceae bacterium]